MVTIAREIEMQIILAVICLMILWEEKVEGKSVRNQLWFGVSVFFFLHMPLVGGLFSLLSSTKLNC